MTFSRPIYTSLTTHLHGHNSFCNLIVFFTTLSFSLNAFILALILTSASECLCGIPLSSYQHFTSVPKDPFGLCTAAKDRQHLSAWILEEHVLNKQTYVCVFLIVIKFKWLCLWCVYVALTKLKLFSKKKNIHVFFISLV